MNSKRVGKVLGTALALFLLAMVMQPVMAGVSAEITGVELNGQGDFIEVAPGEVIEVQVSYKWWDIWSPQEALDQIVVGFEHTPIFCVVDTIINKGPRHGGDYPYYAIETFEITAPTEPGGYCIYMAKATGCTCGEAKVLYQNAFGPEMIPDFDVLDMIADFDVIQSESDECDYLYVSRTDFVDVVPAAYYMISICQRGNDIEVQIETPDVYRIKSGSVSISVPEDIFIDYDTGWVFGIPYQETDYRVIKPTPDPVIQLFEKTFLALAGLIPGVGSSLTLINYANDVSGYKNEYKDDDLTKGHVRIPLRGFFEWSNVSNYRDVVVIPWYLSKGAQSIIVYCPEMIFQFDGTHDIVFRIDCDVYGQRVRHDIALPIKFTSNWNAEKVGKWDPIKRVW